MIRISLFHAPIQNTTNQYFVDLPELFEIIRSDQKIRRIVKQIREFGYKNERDEIKKRICALKGIHLVCIPYWYEII